MSKPYHNQHSVWLYGGIPSGRQEFQSINKMADVLWVLLCLANQTGVNLTEALHQ